MVKILWEATVRVGQRLEAMEHHELLYLVKTAEGSVPSSCLELIPDRCINEYILLYTFTLLKMKHYEYKLL